MAKRGKTGGVGYRKPPRGTRFQKGKSGNPNGRPKGSKNFATVLSDELDDQVPVTENGQRKKITKRHAIIKQVVNQAAGGDLKAAQTVFSQDRLHEKASPADDGFSQFNTPEHHLVMADIVRRIRSMDDVPAAAPAVDTSKTVPLARSSKPKRKDKS